tara:strand:+ start:323 stop:487 length:165 start_codon:yes stop_codon:yes gene_type:complete
MPSYKYKGMIPDDDPRYQEGITILIGLGLNEKPKNNQKNKEKVAKKAGRLGQDS